MGSVLAVVILDVDVDVDVDVVAAKTFRVGRIKTWKIHVTKSVYLAHTHTHTQGRVHTHTHTHTLTDTDTLAYLGI